jgi:hypothetical protein
MNSSNLFLDIKDNAYDESKRNSYYEITSIQKHNSVGDVSENQLPRFSEKDTKFERFNNSNKHICNHVKYTNYSNHLGNHHQTKYTLSKKRLKSPTHRHFDHKFHHRNQKAVKIQENDFFSNNNLNIETKIISNTGSFFNYKDINKRDVIKNLERVKEEKCCIML